MRITDVLTESQLDEIGLGTRVGKAIGKGLTGLAKGYGYVAGIPQAMSRASQQGRAASMANIGHGKYASDQEPDTTAYNQELQARLGAADTGSIQRHVSRLEREIQQLKQQLKAVPNQGQNLSPEQTRKTKQAAATAAARSQMVPKPAGAPAPAPKSPEQIRKEKQSAAAQTAQSSMVPVERKPKPTPPTPEQVRKWKQASAAQAARDQMATPRAAVSESKLFYSNFLQTDL